ncbi:MAG: GH92 family glycosyl hydrolase [Acidobacteriota bacterium]|nr:GH92 family glycosyl hydrolase [Acidobacteriota bacterium]
MRRAIVALLLVLPLQAQSAHPAGPFAHTLAGPVASVDPMIGVGGDPDDGINLFPGAAAPFGMVQLSPETEDKGLGYHSIQKWLKGFSMTHMSGPGCANEGEVFFTATTGPVVTQANDYQTPYAHTQETAEAGYYAVQLLQWKILAELTATPHTGVARFRFPAGTPGNILVPISHTLNQTESAQIRIVGSDRIEGFVEDHAFCNKPGTYKVYFVMTFDQPFTTHGTWTGDEYGGHGTLAPGARTAAQSTHDHTTGAWVMWPAQNEAHSVTARIGISYVDIAGAENNLRAEAAGHDFDSVRRETQQQWNKELGKIEITGGTSRQRRIFYTALYHSQLAPSLFSDADGRYLGFDQRVHTIADGHQVYTNISGWDVYRTQFPLLAMIQPARAQDIAQSIVLMYEQGGWIDRWPQINLYTNDMIGSPLTIMLSTAWLDGLHGFDMDTAWEGMLKDATQAPPAGKPYLGEEGIEWINQLHYLPSDKVTYGSVAKTLEYCLAYAALSRLATDLHKGPEAGTLAARSLSYRNVFDPETGFFRPRRSDGSWEPAFNPAQDGHGFVEGTGWHYMSFAPADMSWLVASMGQARFNQRMDAFFDYPVPGWYAQFYNPLNETDFQAPYAFHFAGRPWRSQQVVRRILRENYLDTPDGIPGNDDLGATSAWAVLSMMGLYSVDPTSLAYELVAPSFPRIVVHLDAPYPAKTFTLTTTGSTASTPYIHSVRINGRIHTQNWLGFDDIRRGSTVAFTLRDTPDESWGTHPEDAPPSISRH